MKLTPLEIADVLLLEPEVFDDKRGYLLETYNRQRYASNGLDVTFVQDNMSSSVRGVLRGLHFQNPRTQGKLVSVVVGSVFDVAVDIRLGSPSFGQWVGVTLSGALHNQLYVPPGFAHGFCVTSESAVFVYKCTDYYAPDCERGISFDDPALGIEWPVKELLISPKDKAYVPLGGLPESMLPVYDRVIPV